MKKNQRIITVVALIISLGLSVLFLSRSLDKEDNFVTILYGITVVTSFTALYFLSRTKQEDKE